MLAYIQPPHGYGYGYPPNPAYPPAPGYGYPPVMSGYGYPPQMPVGVAPQAPQHAAPVAPVTAVAPAFVTFTPNPEDAAQIETWFQELDKDYDGYIGGADVVPFFQRSNVNKPILRDLWNLIDYHKNGRLDRKQFIIAIRMLAVLCSPVYMGSKPTIELFNTTVNKPIALPPQMFQSSTTSSLPAAATSVPATAVASSTSVATATTAAEQSQASVFPTVVQDAPLPPLQSAPVPTPTPAPAPSAAIPPQGPPHGYYPGYPGHAPMAVPPYGYPPVAAPYGGYHSPVPPPAPATQPVTVTDEEDEFSDFNAAPPTATSSSSTIVQAPVPQAAAVKAPVAAASLPPMETDGPWEFVSAQPTPIPSSTHSPIPSSASHNQLPAIPITATTTVSSSHSAANISMLSFDFEDVLPPKPNASNGAAAVPTMTAPVTVAVAVPTIPSSSTAADDAFEFDDFQQAATSAGPTGHPAVSTSVPPVVKAVETMTPSLPTAGVSAPTLAANSTSAMSASANRLAVLDEIIEEDLRMAANEEWDDFESAPSQAQPAATAAAQAVVEPVVTFTNAPPPLTAVSDNPFDLIGDDFEPIAAPAVVSAAPSLLPTSNVATATVTASAAAAPPISVMVDDVDDDDEDDADFGDFASHEPSPVPSKPSATVVTDATLTTATAPTEEDDPFADADFHQASGIDTGASTVLAPVDVATTAATTAAVSVDAIAPSSNDAHADADADVEDDPFAEIPFEVPPPVATAADTDAADSTFETTPAAAVPTTAPIALHEEDPFAEADFQAPATTTTVVAASVSVELPTAGTETAATTMMMMKKAPSLDLLDLDFGPVVESVPLPPLMMSMTTTSTAGAPATSTELNTSTTHSGGSVVATLPSTNKKVDLMDLLDNVYGASNTTTAPPTSAPMPVVAAVTSTNAFGDDDDDDFDPFVAAPSTSGPTVSSTVAVGDVSFPSTQPTTASMVDVNAAFGDDDDDDNDFEPFQSTMAAPAVSTAVKSTDVLFSSANASTSAAAAAASIAVADFDPFATGQDTAAIDDDDFFAFAPSNAASNVKPPSSGTIAKPTMGNSSSSSVTATVSAGPAARGTTAKVAAEKQPPSSPSSSSFVYKSALTTSELEALAKVLAKKHLYDEAYACAKQASVLRTIASLSEAKNIALEEDDLDTAQSINQETHVWMNQLASSAMERHWQYMAQDNKRQGASLDETYENLTFMDATLAKKFQQKFLTTAAASTASSSSDIRTADGTKYVRPHGKVSLELTMKYHVLAKRSARMVMAIMSSHRQHVTAWKQALDMFTKMIQEQDRVWQSVFGSTATLSKVEQQALATAQETRQKFIDPLVAMCETALWLSATCQESLVHEEEARRLWRVAQPLLMVIDDTLHLQNKVRACVCGCGLHYMM